MTSEDADRRSVEILAKAREILDRLNAAEQAEALAQRPMLCEEFDVEAYLRQFPLPLNGRGGR